MAEEMTPEQVTLAEMLNTGTTWTRNDFMEKHGYLVIRDLWNPEELYHSVPMRRGQFTYHSKDLEDYDYEPIEKQVEGSIARYWHRHFTIHIRTNAQCPTQPPPRNSPRATFWKGHSQSRYADY